MCHCIQELATCVERALSPRIQRQARGPEKLESWTSIKWHSVRKRCANATDFSLSCYMKKSVKHCVAGMRKRTKHCPWLSSVPFVSPNSELAKTTGLLLKISEISTIDLYDSNNGDPIWEADQWLEQWMAFSCVVFLQQRYWAMDCTFSSLSLVLHTSHSTHIPITWQTQLFPVWPSDRFITTLWMIFGKTIFPYVCLLNKGPIWGIGMQSNTVFKICRFFFFYMWWWQEWDFKTQKSTKRKRQREHWQRNLRSRREAGWAVINVDVGRKLTSYEMKRPRKELIHVNQTPKGSRIRGL